MGAKYKKVTYLKDSYEILENDCEILKEYKRNLFFIKNEHFEYFIENKSSQFMRFTVEFLEPSMCVFFNELKKLKDWNFEGNQNNFKLKIWSKIGWMVFILKDEVIYVDLKKIDWKNKEWEKYEWEREVSLAEQRAVDSCGFYGELEDLLDLIGG